jgi:glyoxylase-like metal-dependent hydrolase (beta-lactamase superfamily II)
VTHDTRHVGPVEVTAVLDSDFPDEPIVESFLGPAEALLAAKATYPGVYTEDDLWRLRVRFWLLRHPGGLLLLDAGIGGASASAAAWAPAIGALPERLADLGIAPHHVDTVVISHIHDDHTGGLLTDERTPRFANARHVLQRADLDWQRDLARETDDAQAALDQVEVLADAGMLELIDGDLDLSPHLQLHHLPGHTPGHQIVRVNADGKRLTLCADTWNHPAQFAHPDWASATDAHPAQATASRRALLAELLSHPGTLLAPTHLAESFGEVRSGRDGLAAWRALG